LIWSTMWTCWWAVANFLVPLESGSFLINRTTSSFSRTLFHRLVTYRVTQS
jgi:hypothetical protein